MHKNVNNAEIVAKHYNNLKLDLNTRNDSPILQLKNFNNWIKSILIHDVLGRCDNGRQCTVLDLGSGKGGDLLKWAKTNVSHVTFLDIAQESVKESENRYQGRVKSRFTADFNVEDFTTCQFSNLLKRKYDFISCQFAFHYCFESYGQASSTIQNISECLKPGGYFFGTTVNSYELMKMRQKRRSSSNSVFKIKFSNDDPNHYPDLFGEKYHFYLEGAVDCPEYFVYPPLMDKMCLDCGLELVKRKPFTEFFEEKCDEPEGRQLINRMRLFKRIYENEFYKYEHVQTKFSNDKNKPNMIYTLTQDQWDVFSIYNIFVYRKKNLNDI